MRFTGTLSIAIHTAILLFVWFGAPSFRPLITPDQFIEVELVAESDKPEPKKEAKPKPKPSVKPPPPPPPRTSKPEPEPEPEAVPLPKPKPKLAEKPKSKPKPKVKPKPKPKPARQMRRPRPKSKPKPPPQKNSFASVLKTVSKLKNPPPSKAKPKAKKVKETLDFQKQIAAALKRSRPKTPRLGSTASINKLSATIRRQIEKCWSVPGGARGARSMTVKIRTLMNPDGRVRSATIVDTGRMIQDPFYRRMAESARRAVLNQKCQPLRLPLDKYDEWRVIVLTFDPKWMF